MATSNASTGQPLLTADGTPLKTSLQRSMRRSKIRAAMLVLPPLVFLLALFIFPIGNLLTRSTDDILINHQLPLTFAILDQWDRQTARRAPLRGNVSGPHQSEQVPH